jgi:hypothetical protein
LGLVVDLWISVDPGLHDCGVAAWHRNKLLRAELVRAKAWPDMASQVDAWCIDHFRKPQLLIIELPQVYTRTRSKGDPNDLILLAAQVGAFINNFHDRYYGSRYFKPAEWKGQTPKSVTEHRARKRLSPDELSCVHLPSKSLQHNVWDAVGLGHYFIEKA